MTLGDESKVLSFIYFIVHEVDTTIVNFSTFGSHDIIAYII